MTALRGLIRDFRRGGAVSIMAMMVSAAAGAQTPAPDVQSPVAAAAAPTPASDVPAESAPAAADQADAADREIVVTGSRITGGFTSPTPVTVLSSERANALVINNVG